MTTQQAQPGTSAVESLVKDIHDAIAEFAGVARYPDLNEAIDHLAALAAQAAPSQDIDPPDDDELESWRAAATTLRTVHCRNVNTLDLRDAAIKLENAYLFAMRLRAAAPQPPKEQP